MLNANAKAMAWKIHRRGTHDGDKGHRVAEFTIVMKKKHRTIRDSYDVFEEDEEAIQSIRNPAYVGGNTVLTHNLGDGDYIKVGISIEVPCRTTRVAVKNTTIRVRRFIRDRIATEFDAAKKQIQSL